MYLISGKEWLKKKKGKGKSKGFNEMKTSHPAVSPEGGKEIIFEGKDSMHTLQEMLAAKREELESRVPLKSEERDNGETDEGGTKMGMIVDLCIYNSKILMLRAFLHRNKIF